ncbi:hypothetical protein NHM07_09300 [Bacillus subtilis]|uniref:hypothetical protein n=1 Tax=Bacillus subtilis TaxID=1423 RepID=UPI00059C3DE6|nr:hypothetical protein [Bacillus subtilis]MCO8148736.1 hypothetical protein [Bacillus subtilis]MDQ4710996.1 hypothetical protein [Bacillus subtilis]MEC2180257.1 hypothetical protein [Bacillus subtilis]QHM18502.1 hypothetical protein C7M30_02209 [Bacillus subtilis]CAF1824100.1 hypothetical protein NRS6131_02476 [Bacillus subtilis]
MDKVNDKIGNVRLFKKHLRKKGLIGNRQQFSDEHVKLFKKIKSYKMNHHTTWDMAFKVGLDSYQKQNQNMFPLLNEIAESPSCSIDDKLTEILKVLQRIESKIK